VRSEERWERGGFSPARSFYTRQAREDHMNEMTLRNELRDIFKGFGYATLLDESRSDLIVRRPINDMLHDDLLWIETKKEKTDEVLMLSQLILTAKRANLDGNAYPRFFGVYDGLFFRHIKTSDIAAIMDRNEINWNETPSSPSRKTMDTVERFRERIVPVRSESGIRRWLEEIDRENEPGKIQIDVARVTGVFDHWIGSVWPTINAWHSDIDLKPCDFFLADLMSSGNATLRKKLRILLETDSYRIQVMSDNTGGGELNYAHPSRKYRTRQ
jgi:hypothetical protein